MATTPFPNPITTQFSPAAWAIADGTGGSVSGNFVTYPTAQNTPITFPNSIITPSITSTGNMTIAPPASNTMTIANSAQTRISIGAGIRTGVGAGNGITHIYSGANGALITNNVTLNNGDQNQSSTFIQCGPGTSGVRSNGNVEIKTGIFNSGEVRIGQFTSDTNKTTTVINGNVNIGTRSTTAIAGSTVTTSGLLIKQVVPCPLATGVSSIETIIGNTTTASAMSTTFNQKSSEVDLAYIPSYAVSTNAPYVTQYFEIVVSASQGASGSGVTFVYKGSFALTRGVGLVSISSVNTIFSFGGNALIRFTDNGGSGGTLSIQTCQNNAPSLNTHFVCALMSYPCVSFSSGNFLLEGYTVVAI